MCDDVKLISSNPCCDTKNYFEWCKANYMVLSLRKYCSMIVVSRQRFQNFDSTMDINTDDTVIPCVPTTIIYKFTFHYALRYTY